MVHVLCGACDSDTRYQNRLTQPLIHRYGISGNNTCFNFLIYKHGTNKCWSLAPALSMFVWLYNSMMWSWVFRVRIFKWILKTNRNNKWFCTLNVIWMMFVLCRKYSAFGVTAERNAKIWYPIRSVNLMFAIFVVHCTRYTKWNVPKN